MTALQLNAELFRAMGKIADDETLMKKVLNYVKRLAAKKEDPTLMTKEEFFCRVDEAKKGPTYRMLPDEDLKDNIETAIKSQIKSIFEAENKNKEGEEYIKNYVKIYYVNLVKDLSLGVPVFGIDNVLNFFKEIVPQNNWENLKKACKSENKEDCVKYCDDNPFLKIYSNFLKIKERNRKEAKKYLNGLRAGAIVSGMIPGVDIGMEYLYKYKFLEKLKALYGFDFNEEKENENNKNNKKKEEEKKEEKEKKEKKEKKENKEKKEKKEENEEEKLLLDDENSVNKTNTIEFNKNDDEKNDIKQNNKENEENKTENYRKEEDIECAINDEIHNTKKNMTSIFRGLGEIGGIILKAFPTAGRVTLETGEVVTRIGVSIGIKIVSWVCLPITCIAFGAWSFAKINNDCNKIIDIFEEAFIPLKYKTLMAYINSFLCAIEYLEEMGKKIVEGKNI